MDQKLYKLMNWPRIEGIIYSEEDQPYEILGPHVVGKNTLFQTFQPEAKEVYLCFDNKKKKMELVDETGFFAYLLLEAQPEVYHFEVHYEENVTEIVEDAYQYQIEFPKKAADKLNAGILYDSYQYLGAHLITMIGCEGCIFRVFAPDAIRVSVVGSFNHFDGRRHQMKRDKESGVFQIFIPSVKAGDTYQYEMKLKGDIITLKNDPYAFESQVSPDEASVISDSSSFEWKDETWMLERIKKQGMNQPLSVLECYLGDYHKKKDKSDRLNYSEIGKLLVKEVAEAGYTHVQLMPVMEYLQDESLGYQTKDYYAPTTRYGSADDLKEMIDTLHQANIGVLLEWVPNHFLYTHDNRPQASNYLIANAFYWVEEFHVDGLSVVGNIPEDPEIFKHLNSVMAMKHQDVYLIAQDDASQGGVSDALNEGGLGFSAKWNKGFVNDLFSYMDFDPYFRSYHQDLLSNSMVYQYSENYILAISHNDAIYGGESLLDKMPGSEKDQEASLRLLYAYLYTHPGKKLFFQDQKVKENQGMQALLKDLNALYMQKPALYQKDNELEGFEWINCMSNEQCMISYLRKGEKEEDTLLVVANFAGTEQEFVVGTPLEGKYKEILNTDAKAYGGNSTKATKLKRVSEIEADGREYSLQVKLAPLSLCVYALVPYTKKEKEEIEQRKAENRARCKVQEAKDVLELAKEEAEKIKKVYEAALVQVSEAEKAVKKAEDELKKYE